MIVEFLIGFVYGVYEILDCFFYVIGMVIRIYFKWIKVNIVCFVEDNVRFVVYFNIIMYVKNMYLYVILS